jgi:hypothetical protein
MVVSWSRRGVVSALVLRSVFRLFSAISAVYPPWSVFIKSVAGVFPIGSHGASSALRIARVDIIRLWVRV